MRRSRAASLITDRQTDRQREREREREREQEIEDGRALRLLQGGAWGEGEWQCGCTGRPGARTNSSHWHGCERHTNATPCMESECVCYRTSA